MLNGLGWEAVASPSHILSCGETESSLSVVAGVLRKGAGGAGGKRTCLCTCLGYGC